MSRHRVASIQGVLPAFAVAFLVLLLAGLGDGAEALAAKLDQGKTPAAPIRFEVLPGAAEKWIDPILAERIPVVVYGDAARDVRELDPVSLVLAGAAVAKRDDGSLATYRDFDGDGTIDLLVQFASSALGQHGPSGRVSLTGRTIDGAAVEGTAVLRTVESARTQRRLAARSHPHVEKLPPLQVQIEVLPGSPTKRIELGNRGTLSVAVLSTSELDATRLDPVTLHLAGAPATRRTGGGLASFEDVNGDGLRDLVVEVPKKLLRMDGGSREAILTGFTREGRFLIGSEPISVEKTAAMVFDSDDPKETPWPEGVAFSSGAAITINDAAPATPYPSIIGVAGLTGVISKARVTLHGLAHGFPNDIDILLVGPTGQSMILMSDVGGTAPVSNVTLTFDDDAALLPDPGVSAATGTFRPTNFVAGDAFPAPAPVPAAATTLSAFNGTSPNGNWSLYVLDDLGSDTGVIARGWSIDFVLATEFCNAGPITINDAAAATPYPALISVSGLTGSVVKVTPVFRGLSHTFPADLDAILQGPTGVYTMVVSDTGGGNPGVTGVTLVFDENAPLAVDPLSNPISGTYAPTDFTAGDSFPAPAPTPPYPLGFAQFRGTSPNGFWTLFLVDDAPGDTGTLNRVCLQITTMTPVDNSNATNITIPSSAPFTTSGPAGPYPSTIDVTGVIGTISRVNVTLRALSHTFPGDLDILLRSPNGANVMLMSDVGGGSPGVNGVTYTFDDTGLVIPGSNVGTGTYRPTNNNAGGADAMAAPAPAGPYGTTLGSLAGQSPVGAWNLFVVDDGEGDVGAIGLGWTLTFQTYLPSYGGCNVSAVTIPAGAPGTTSGPASAYPIGIVQIGVPVDLDQYKVRVELRGVTHSFPRDLDVLIVGPQGQKVLLLSDAAGEAPGVSGVNLSFDDDAVTGVPQLANPAAGVYRPTDFEPGESLPAPAPPGPYATSLSAFKGTNPLGPWALYVADDFAGDVGSMSSWCLNFLPSISAGEVPNLRFADESSVAWDAGANATSYNLYRGDSTQLPGLVDHTVDSCLRGSTSSQQFAGLVETPPVGSFHWYLVRGNNAQGEGPAGFERFAAQILARIEDSSGVCP